MKRTGKYDKEIMSANTEVCVGALTSEQLREILITPDGRGELVKEWALDELIERLRSR